MICHEFDQEVSIKNCRRLGNRIIGKSQNVLVTLSSTDEAQFLVANARSLRQSQNEFVRKNICSNPDLTPADAKAAYELRCVRRERTKTRQSTRATTADSSLNGSSLNRPAGNLKITATEFVPIPVSSDGITQNGMPASAQ